MCVGWLVRGKKKVGVKKNGTRERAEGEIIENGGQSGTGLAKNDKTIIENRVNVGIVDIFSNVPVNSKREKSGIRNKFRRVHSKEGRFISFEYLSLGPCQKMDFSPPKKKNKKLKKIKKNIFY